MKLFLKYIFLLFIGVFITSGLAYCQANFTVQVSNFSFTPKDINVTAGDTVTFQWVSGTHTTTSDSTTGPDSWNSPISSSVPVYKVVILYPGLHRFYCIPHGGPGGIGMSGSITANPKAPTYVQTSEVAISYSLGQNYPNPFNPSTKIEYSIPENGLVTLKIYNSLGEEIKTLINENHSRGTYSVVFNASGFPSGIYYYQIKSGNYVSVRKMILIK